MATSDVMIRPLVESDLGEWLRLRQLLWEGSSEDDHKEEMFDVIEHADTQFVAVADAGGGRLVGFLEASIRTHVEDCETENVGYLEGWYVEEEFRHSGIGRQLVAYAEEWARGLGSTEMASDAEIDNEASLKAHLSLGYQETSRLVHLRKVIA